MDSGHVVDVVKPSGEFFTFLILAESFCNEIENEKNINLQWKPGSRKKATENPSIMLSKQTNKSQFQTETENECVRLHSQQNFHYFQVVWHVIKLHLDFIWWIVTTQFDIGFQLLGQSNCLRSSLHIQAVQMPKTFSLHDTKLFCNYNVAHFEWNWMMPEMEGKKFSAVVCCLLYECRVLRTFSLGWWNGFRCWYGRRNLWMCMKNIAQKLFVEGLRF